MQYIYMLVGKPSRYEIDAAHRWGLPGIDCPRCGPWSTTGLVYPTIDLTGLPFSDRLENGWCASVDEYRNFDAQVRSLLPENAVLAPGAEFGPLHGDARGIFSHFSWPSPWELLIDAESLGKLLSLGIRGLSGVPVKLKYEGSPPPADLLELQIEYHSYLAPTALPAGGLPPCEVCGLREVSAPDDIVLTQSSIPTHLDIFRGCDLTTHTFATESFVRAVITLQLKGVSFQKVRTSDESIDEYPWLQPAGKI